MDRQPTRTLARISSLLLLSTAAVGGCEPQVLDDDDTPLELSVGDLELETDEDVPLDLELPLPEGAVSNLLDYSVVSGPSHGELEGQGAYRTYTPDPNYSGSDAFAFRVSEGELSAEGEVRIEIASVEDAPIPEADEATLEEDTSVSIYVLANDSDPEGDDFGLLAVGTPTNGMAEIEPAGTIRYTPDPDFHGDDSFTYVVEDETGMSSSGDVAVTVTPVADSPVAVDDSVSVAEDGDTLIAVLENDYHPDDLLLVLDSVGEATHGTTSIDGEEVRYVPDLEFSGEDSFSYVISDSLGLTATATVTVLVSDLADPPTAVADLVSTMEDTP